MFYFYGLKFVATCRFMIYLKRKRKLHSMLFLISNPNADHNLIFDILFQAPLRPTQDEGFSPSPSSS
jgi:hypothetical protein